MRVLSIFGTRPEAIKLAPVINELRKFPDLDSRICVTAQHRQMLDQVLELFAIQPDHDLDIMRKNQSLFDLTSRALDALQPVLIEERPDVVLVQGDTTTALTAALAAYYLQIKVAHVEAGLRTGDPYNPFPEEINRRLVDALADYCFAPTERARKNLLAEGVSSARIYVTGNTVIDALLDVVRQQRAPTVQERLRHEFERRYNIKMEKRRLVLVTGHRRESFGPDFENICRALKKVAEKNPDVLLVYPVHLNPNVQEPVQRVLGSVPRIHLIEPMGYESFVWLMSQAELILTDSGGIQEEAPSLGKPVLVMRTVTERPEAVEAGTARLVGTASGKIYEETQRLLDDKNEYLKMACASNPFGDGTAASKIVKVLREFL